jgi:hypothetical protein
VVGFWQGPTDSDFPDLSFETRAEPISRTWSVAMALVKLRKANEAGEEVGTVIVNTDQIIAVGSGPKATELQMTDGRTR